MDSKKPVQSGSAVVVYVTVPNDCLAKSLASSIVECKLAACVSIIPGICAVMIGSSWAFDSPRLLWISHRVFKAGVQSVYWWENKVNIDAELMLMIKTRSELVNELTGDLDLI